MSLDRWNLPVKIFYANLLHMGIRLRVKDGALRIGGSTELCTPVLQKEIEKRAEHLIAMLTPEPPKEMASHFGRLLTLDEMKQAVNTAAFFQIELDTLPVDGGWLITMRKEK